MRLFPRTAGCLEQGSRQASPTSRPPSLPLPSSLSKKILIPSNLDSIFPWFNLQQKGHRNSGHPTHTSGKLSCPDKWFQLMHVALLAMLSCLPFSRAALRKSAGVLTPRKTNHGGMKTPPAANTTTHCGGQAHTTHAVQAVPPDPAHITLILSSLNIDSTQPLHVLEPYTEKDQLRSSRYAHPPCPTSSCSNFKK